MATHNFYLGSNWVSLMRGLRSELSGLNRVFWDNNYDQYLEPLLDISRKPQKLANIFCPAD